jgi:hypothetical protein
MEHVPNGQKVLYEENDGKYFHLLDPTHYFEVLLKNEL